MPTCCIIGCSNSSNKQHKMCYFPADLQRREMWIKQINRKDWNPTNYSAVCEVHFSSNMWEKLREDGKKKLKPFAFPDIFVNSISTSIPRIPSSIPIVDHFLTLSEQSAVQCKANMEIASENKDEKMETPDIKLEEDNDLGECMESSIVDINLKEDESETIQAGCNVKQQEAEILLNLQEKEQEVKELRKTCKYLRMKRKEDQRTIKHQQHEIEQLKKKVGSSESKLHAAARRFFDDDQLRLLAGDVKKITNWCDSTIDKSLKLKFACGTAGYSELLRQGYPLPSLRTLRSKLENFKFDIELTHC